MCAWLLFCVVFFSNTIPIRGCYSTRSSEVWSVMAPPLLPFPLPPGFPPLHSPLFIVVSASLLALDITTVGERPA